MNAVIQTMKKVTEESSTSIGKAIAFLVFGLSFFSLMDVIIKTLSDTYPAHEIVFVRGIVAMLPIIGIVYLNGGIMKLRTKIPLLHISRGLLGFISFSLYYLALASLPLADVVTIFFAAPLFISILGFWFLGEKVGVHRWSAIAFGFLGVIIVTQPSTDSIELPILLAVGAAMFYASMNILTKIISRTDSGSTQAFYSMLVYIAMSAFIGLLIGSGKFAGSGDTTMEFLFRAWIVPSAFDAMLLIIAGLIAGVGFFCLSQAYKSAPVSVVSPFEYISLPWAILWGFVFWSDLPSGTTLLGLTFIVGSGLYIIYRETILGKRLVRGRRSRLQI